ncbi:MAG: hypothetical protein J6X44_13625, partial [Thermoguttaceae bacterium]|nr:hypothetical protein [Thermoguttaceae bacterium]
MNDQKDVVKRVVFLLGTFAFLAFFSGTFGLWSDISRGFQAQASAAEDDVREWTDSTGKFKVQATLVAHDDENVTLRKTDDRVVKLPLKKLSDEDQAYIASLDENPFAGGVLIEDSDAEDVQTSSGAFKMKGKTHRFATCPTPVYLGDSSGLQPKFLTGNAPWKVSPSKSVPKKTETVGSVPVCNQTRIGNRPISVNMLEPNDNSPYFFLGYTVGTLDAAKNYLERCDISKGTGEIAEVPGGVDISFQSVSPDGKYIAAIMGLKPESGGFAKNALLAVFSLDSFSSKGEFKPCALFCPSYEETLRGRYDVKTIVSAQWVDNERVLLTTERDSVTLWNLSTCKAEYSLKGDGTCKLDPSRRYFYVATKSGVSFYASSNGEALGGLDFSSVEGEGGKPSNFHVMECALSPDGGRIAVKNGDRLLAFDLTTGKYVGGFSGSFTFGTPPVWTDDKSIMIGHDLYDLASGLPVCAYDNISNSLNPGLFCGGLYWCVCGGYGADLAVVGCKLPHVKAVDLLKNVDVDNFFSIHPGVSFSIKLDLHGFFDEAEVQRLLEDVLTRNGMKYDPRSKLVLKASCVDTKREEETT